MVGFKIQVRKEPKDNRTENKYRISIRGGNGGSGCMGERVTKGGEPVNNQGVWNVGGL